MYGLKDAPLLWHLRCVATLRELGLEPSPHDKCVWKKVDKKSSRWLLLMSWHVDDTLVTGDSGEIAKLHKALEQRFGPM